MGTAAPSGPAIRPAGIAAAMPGSIGGRLSRPTLAMNLSGFFLKPSQNSSIVSALSALDTSGSTGMPASVLGGSAISVVGLTRFASGAAGGIRSENAPVSAVNRSCGTRSSKLPVGALIVSAGIRSSKAPMSFLLREADFDAPLFLGAFLHGLGIGALVHCGGRLRDDLLAIVRGKRLPCGRLRYRFGLRGRSGFLPLALRFLAFRLRAGE